MISPGLRSFNYFSAAQSKYHIWFEMLGFPQLDITQYDDGEWSIIEYQHKPLIPSECKYKVVLSGMKNIEISYGFIQRYIDEINPMSSRFWENVEKHERMLDIEYNTNENNAIDRAQRASRFVIQNPDLMNRIAKNGFAEMNPLKILKHVPKYQLR